MGFKIEKAERRRVSARVGLIGPSGSGKTYSSLLLARGLVGPEGKIGLIDTEGERGLYYADEFQYDRISFTAPYSPERFIESITAFEAAGYDVIIVDTVSHEWAGVGGILDTLDKMPGDKSFMKWATLTPRHNAFIDKILRCSTHLILNFRGKDTYVMELDKNGKQAPKKVGLGAVQRDGFEYEMTVSLMLDVESHGVSVQKDNTHLWENRYDKITLEDGQKLREWCERGVAGTKENLQDALALIREAKTREALTAVLEQCPSLKDQLIPACKGRQMELIIERLRSETTASALNQTLHGLSVEIDRLNGQYREAIMKEGKRLMDALTKSEKKEKERQKEQEPANA
jgi:hypothetical protein